VPHRTPLALIERAATEILTLIGEMEEHDFFATRLTRAEAVKRLGRIAEAVEALPQTIHAALPEIDWKGWRELGQSLASAAAPQAAVWHAVSDLTPATLQWLRVYRDEQPQLFAPAP